MLDRHEDPLLTRTVSHSVSDGCELFAAVLPNNDAIPLESANPPIILLHGGGPDHRMFLPLAQRLARRGVVVLPDVRGYGKSICTDPNCHTWARYARDVVDLLDCLELPSAVIGGAGLGSTISLRTAIAFPERVQALVLISVEDIEDDAAKAKEIDFMDAFAERVRTEDIEAGWRPILPMLAPLIGELVREAIPRCQPDSIAAAAAIGHDRSFQSIDELKVLKAPTLIFPGMDARHPLSLAEALARLLPRGRMADVRLTSDMLTAEDLARSFYPAIERFLTDFHRASVDGGPPD